MPGSFAEWYSPSVHPIYRTVTRIRFAEQEGHATGFFYNSKDNTYLITNKHVIESNEPDEDRNSPDSIRIFTRSVELGEREFHDISLTDGEMEDWYTHPFDVDIAVIPLSFVLDCVNHWIGIYDERPLETGSLAFNKDSILSEKDRVKAGNRSEIVGYPGHYTDQNHDFPVTRNAIVASQYGFPYNGSPLFLTDARMHPGTSGSPVLAGPETLVVHQGISTWGPGYKLLGVHSARLEQPLLEQENQFLDLNTAWYAELVEEIIQGIEGDDDIIARLEEIHSDE